MYTFTLFPYWEQIYHKCAYMSSAFSNWPTSTEPIKHVLIPSLFDHKSKKGKRYIFPLYHPGTDMLHLPQPFSNELL